MSAPAEYDLNEVADALAAVFNGLATGDNLAGVAQKVTAYADVPGTIEVPALVLELDDITWDLDMGDGADSFTFIATALVEFQDAKSAQRALRAFMSRKVTSGVGRLKGALEADKTLGGLVSYAHMSNARSIGGISYGGANYLGAELVIEVMS